MSILVVEDEKRVRAFIERGLCEEGYSVRSAADGDAAASMLASEAFDLVLLDWMLPGRSGSSLLEEVRARGDTVPVVMLTARDAVADRVAALDKGADDYLVKPFAFEELLARVRAVLRRAAGRADTKLICDDLQLDPLTRRVSRGGREIRLTTREFSLLRFLLEHQNEVVSRARIIEAVWEHDFETFSNVVEVYIRYLRAKVDALSERKLIHTVRGAGYVLRAES